jgi:hypothetical protein
MRHTAGQRRCLVIRTESDCHICGGPVVAGQRSRLGPAHLGCQGHIRAPDRNPLLQEFFTKFTDKYRRRKAHP